MYLLHREKNKNADGVFITSVTFKETVSYWNFLWRFFSKIVGFSEFYWGTIENFNFSPFKFSTKFTLVDRIFLNFSFVTDFFPN